MFYAIGMCTKARYFYVREESLSNVENHEIENDIFIQRPVVGGQQTKLLMLQCIILMLYCIIVEIFTKVGTAVSDKKIFSPFGWPLHRHISTAAGAYIYESHQKSHNECFLNFLDLQKCDF